MTQLIEISPTSLFSFPNRTAGEEYETDLIRMIRSGVYSALLPETPDQLRSMIARLTIKRTTLPWPFLNGFLHLRLQMLK